jgi:excisionase family DNA binding protein
LEQLAVSVDEAAEALGISRGHAFGLAKAGVLPTIKLGRRLVVPLVELVKLVEPAGTVARRNGR